MSVSTNKFILSKNIAKKIDISADEAKVIINIFIESLKNSLIKGERIEIRGFGIFKVKTRKSSIRRNPKTGEKVIVPPKKIISFKASEELISMVNS